MEFVATKQVRSNAPMSPIVCDVGDTITVDGWYCKDGPTVIKVKSLKHGDTRQCCIPFSWVEEMGAPPELKKQMRIKV